MRPAKSHDMETATLGSGGIGRRASTVEFIPARAFVSHKRFDKHNKSYLKYYFEKLQMLKKKGNLIFRLIIVLVE